MLGTCAQTDEVSTTEIIAIKRRLFFIFQRFFELAKVQFFMIKHIVFLRVHLRDADASMPCAASQYQNALRPICLTLKKVDTKVNKNGKRRNKNKTQEIMLPHSGRSKA
jgi:hypothetical protein